VAYTWSSIQVLPAITIAGTNTAEGTDATESATCRKPNSQTPASYTIGTGLGAANKCHFGKITLSATPTTIDLTSMSFGIGDSSIAKVKGWYIENLTTTASRPVTVGNAASAQFPFKLGAATNTFVVAEGGATIYFEKTTNGIATSSANNVKLDPGANTVDCFVAFWGE
jgi:hypothetical protein